MKSSAKLEVQLLVDACLKGGVTHIVLSPGSRNAPLSIAFDEHPGFTTYVIPDERSAAFYALGMAQQLKQPVAIACTSGSAPLNYFPAVAEAYYQGIPLVILTADRPKEWVDQGDGQTIVQENVFGSHVLAAAQLDAIHNDQQRWLFERQCAEVIQKAIGRRKGPVHLNVPFTEPLYAVTEEIHAVKNRMLAGEGILSLSASERAFVQETWQASSKRMILCGQLPKNELLEQELALLAQDPSVIVIVEHTSNLTNEQFIHCTDRALNQIAAAAIPDFQPDLLIVLGGAIVSKRIKTFLRTAANLQTIRVSPDFPFMDTFQSLVFSSAVEPEAFVKELNTGTTAPSSFGTAWKQLDLRAQKKHTVQLENTVFSDLKAMETVWSAIPEHTHVHIANSSIIRYALLFDPVKNNRYWCNRGTSGIDGSSSTACGAALIAAEQTHVLISGDMSFFYDSNAFWNNHTPSNLRVIVLNNGGGDIFNIIPGPDTTAQRDRFFVAKQQFSAEHICTAYGLDYCSADSVESIALQLKGFFDPLGDGRPKLLEIQTAGIENSAILRGYFEETK